MLFTVVIPNAIAYVKYKYFAFSGNWNSCSFTVLIYSPRNARGWYHPLLGDLTVCWLYNLCYLLTRQIKMLWGGLLFNDRPN